MQWTFREVSRLLCRASLKEVYRAAADVLYGMPSPAGFLGDLRVLGDGLARVVVGRVLLFWH